MSVVRHSELANSTSRHAPRCGWVHNGQDRRDKFGKVDYVGPKVSTVDVGHEEENDRELARSHHRGS